MAVPQYASLADLTGFLGVDYEVPAQDEADRILTRASEVISHATIGLAAAYWHDISVEDPHDDHTEALRDATCAQVEYWLEVGEEHDIVGLTGLLIAGKLHVSELPGRLAPRARTYLIGAGLYHGRAGIR